MFHHIMIKKCLAILIMLALTVSHAIAGQSVEEKLLKEQAVSRTFSVYIPMRDGVRIAADIHLPKSLKPGQVVPTLLYQTIYLRSHRIPVAQSPSLAKHSDWKTGPRLDHDPTRPIDFLALENGYAIVKVDVRGTGASFGQRHSPLPPAEVQDTKEIIDWIIAQPWSNKKVGTFGVSYSGMTAGMATTVNHPALKAVVLGWTGTYDLFKTAMQPFGFVQPGVLCKWSDFLANLWSNNWQATGKSPMPVDGDDEGKLLAQALKEHQKNETVCDLLSDVTYSDDVIGKNNISIQSFSQKDFKKTIEASGVAMLTLASWFDTGVVDAHFVRLHDFTNEQKIFLTGGQHGARYHSSPYQVSDKPIAPIPSGDVTWGKAITFFDYYLKDQKNGYDQWPTVTYWNLGEEKFRTSGRWPIAGAHRQRFYFDKDYSLDRQRPNGKTESDVYKVNFETTTGKSSRWWTGLGTPMLNLDDRKQQDDKMLVYTSEPLARDMQITGWPVVSLNVSSTHSDGAFIAYLEDVDENGKSTYVNEGGLRAIHRKLSDNPVKQLSANPYHTFAKKDAMPLVPGQKTTIKFEMIPTSVRIAKGHRLRIAIAGADKDNFVRIPSQGHPTIHLYRGGDNPSYVEFPIVDD